MYSYFGAEPMAKGSQIPKNPWVTASDGPYAARVCYVQLAQATPLRRDQVRSSRISVEVGRVLVWKHEPLQTNG